MVKKNPWSADAIIERAQQQADVRKSEFESAKKSVKEAHLPAEETAPAPPSAMEQYKAGEKVVYEKKAEEEKQELPYIGTAGFWGMANQPKFEPASNDWNYKNAKVDLQGRPIETRSFLGIEVKPKGFDPYGRPYFGGGGSEWLKRFAYNMSEGVATQQAANDSWKQVTESWKQFAKNATTLVKPSDYYKLPDLNGVNPNSPEGREIIKANRAKTAEGVNVQTLQTLSSFMKLIGDTITANRKSDEAAEQKTIRGQLGILPTTYFVRLVNQTIGGVLELIQGLSELPERTAGVLRAEREYATEAGSFLPDLAFDPDAEVRDTEILNFFSPKDGFKVNHEAANFITRLISPALTLYDQARFIFSPGSFDEKMKVIENGWHEGRILYTETMKESVRNDFVSRMRNGEDPYLLAMELEDPWIEMAGEMIFDPLNFAGALGKAKKAASYVDEATRVVQRNGLMNSPEFAGAIKKLGNITNDVEGSKVLAETRDLIKARAAETGVKVAGIQEYKAFSFTPEANKIRERKVFGNYFATITQAIRNSGGSADDVAEYINAIRKMSSGDDRLITEGMALISHSPLQVMAFNDSAFEVGHLLNKIMGDGDIVNDIQKLGGDYVALNKYLDSKIDKAMDYAFPSIKEMSNAADKAADMVKAGEEVDDATRRLADAFDLIKKEHPGYIRWANFHDAVDSTLKPLNAFLSNNYFSLSYGYAFKNLTQNLFTLFVDDGISFANGFMKFDPQNGFITPKLDDFILKQNGGAMPELFNMSKTFVGSTTEGSIGGRFFNWLNSKGWSPAKMSQAFEIYSGKMIYVKNYKKTYDKIAVLGGMFPDVAKWTSAGYLPEQADDFVKLFRANDYDMAATTQAFAAKYGAGEADKWRLLDFVDPQVEEGLKDYGSYWDDVLKAVNDPNKNYTDALDEIDNMMLQVKRDANKAGNTPAQLPDNDGLAKVIMDDGAAAGKFQNQAADNQLINLRIHADRTVAELRDALMKVYRTVPEEQANPIFNMLSEVAHSQRKEDVIRVTQELVNGTVALKNKVAKTSDLAALWDVELMGEIPKGIITKDVFYQSMWNGYYVKRAEMWNNFFDTELLQYVDYAKSKPELSELFGKANLANIKLQAARDFLYTPKGIFTRPPKIIPAALGTAQNGTTVRTLGGVYGVGVDDKHLLNVINKHAPAPIKSVRKLGDDVVKFLDSNPDPTDPEIQKQILAFSEKYKAKALGGVTDNYQGILDRLNTMRNTDDYVAESLIGKVYRGKPAYSKLDDVPPDIAEKVFSERAGHINAGFVKKLDDVNYGASDVTQGIPVPPARDPNVSPNAHAFAENRDGTLAALQTIRDGIRDRAGLKVKVPTASQTLEQLMPDIVDKMSVANAKSKFVAEKYRDFALLPYGEKTNMDLAMGMVYPYQFWYSRTYSNWIKRAFGSNPEIISRYANLKEAMSREQKDLPDWWKSQLNVSQLFGVDTKNPMYINLEAALFPLYGLTGTDFNDPLKRVNWWTTVIDDMGKMGPSMFAPIQLAVAVALQATGEQEAATRWGGRLIPQTATFKSVSSLFGKPIELDPAIQYFSGEGFLDFSATDPYEENRIKRALAAMKGMPGVTEEMLMEAAYTQKGPLWEQAYINAVRGGAPGEFPSRVASQVTSFFLGTGWKQRTQEDIKVDQFYSDYYRMKNLRDGGYMTDEQYKLAFDKMREAYPFMDVLLLSRRSGDSRDAAYAFNIASRIPPGMSSEFYDVVGLDAETVQKFYDAGGFYSYKDGKKTPVMSETEQAVFINKMVDLGAMLKIPSTADRQEWTQVRIEYNNMNKKLESTYGKDILDKISLYYGITDMNAARDFLEKNPKVQAAMDAKTAMIAGDPELMKYYGGLSTLERYHTGLMYDELEKEFGKNITKTEQAYFDIYNMEQIRLLQENPQLEQYWDRKGELNDEVERTLKQEFGNDIIAIADGYSDLFTKEEKRKYLRENPQLRGYWDMRDDLRKANNEILLQEFGPDIKKLEGKYYSTDLDERGQFLEQYPELREYWAKKAEMKEEVRRAIVNFSQYLPEPPMPELTGKTPENPTETRIQEFARDKPEVSYQQWQNVIGADASELIESYWYNDEELPKEVVSNLDYLSEDYGFRNGEEMLRAILISMPQEPESVNSFIGQ